MSENAFLFYETFLDAIEQAQKYEKGYEMAKAIINYGLYHDESEDADPLIQMGLAQIKNDIDRAQLRYAQTQTNGAMGGRPKNKLPNADLMEFLQSGATQEQASEKFGVSVRTIQRRVKQFKDAKRQLVGGMPEEKEAPSQEGQMELAASRLKDPETGTWEF